MITLRGSFLDICYDGLISPQADFLFLNINVLMIRQQDFLHIPSKRQFLGRCLQITDDQAAAALIFSLIGDHAVCLLIDRSEAPVDKQLAVLV